MPVRLHRAASAHAGAVRDNSAAVVARVLYSRAPIPPVPPSSCSFSLTPQLLHLPGTTSAPTEPPPHSWAACSRALSRAARPACNRLGAAPPALRGRATCLGPRHQLLRAPRWLAQRIRMPRRLALPGLLLPGACPSAHAWRRGINRKENRGRKRVFWCCCRRWKRG
jgi:hypothetical protein